MLRPLGGAPATRNIMVYDLEWVPGTLQTRVVGCYDGNRYRWYRTVQAFLDNELTKKNRGKWFYAHAGGLADVQFLLPRFYECDSYQVEASFSGSSAIALTVTRGKDKWHFIDSYWLLRDSLDNIAKSVGMRKTGPAELGLTEPEDIKHWYATAPESELVPYNEIDCVILYDAILRFQEEILELGGQLQKTIASTAMNLFRRVYQKDRVYTHEEVNEESRESYFASRVEVFQTHCKDAYYFDINSSFPHSMTYPVPGSLDTTTRTFSESWIEDDSKPFLTKVEFTVPDIWFPTTPTRYANRVFFPTGRWSGWLTSPDIRLLKEQGGIIHAVHKTRLFHPFYGLADYVADIYERRRKETDPFRRLVYKYLLNSLYGKFAESPEKEQLLIHPERSFTLEEKKQWMLTPGVYIIPQVMTIAHEHVPISSHVTARSRRLLYNYMEPAAPFHYCDTDGFSTEKTLETTDALGGLKLEKVLTSGHYKAPKVYRIDGTVDGEKKTIVRAKGFSLGKGQKAIDNFTRLVNGYDVEVDRMARIRENLRKGRTEPHESTIRKRLQNQMPKRFTFEDGTTRPWTMNELKEKFG